MKVFREWKYRQSGGASTCGWVQKCEGKTEREMREIGFACHYDWLVEENNMKKKDLKNEDIVTLRNGDRLIFDGYSLIDLSDDNNNCLMDIDDLENDLTYDCEKDYDIVKVERPVKYETVFEREEVKEMTVDEISKKLGYKVKVVGEDR